MAEENQGSGQQGAPDTKAHEPPVAPRESGDVAAGHEAPLQRSHEPPQGSLELGHQSPPTVTFEAGEMHSPATPAPRPTTPPPKPSDAAQSVRPPEARQESAPEQPSSGDE